ncbi:hypothetical protein FBU30_009685 [Linnemannia zychae]|nr:hypothetical protein FBU30_009685 [Linnemannia zychae]
MDSSALPSTKQTRFVEWLTANNAFFPKLEFRDDAHGCGSVYAAADIAEDEVFLTIPFEPLVITDALARKHLPLSAQTLDTRTVIMLFLIQQMNLSSNQTNDEEDTASTSSASFYKPYLDMIPDKIHTALNFDDQELEQLRGTNAYMAVKDQKEILRQLYDKTMETVGEDLKVEDGYTWERFTWAKSVLTSRTFPASLFGEVEDGDIVLIPLADSLNHKSRHKITWHKEANGLQMSSAAIKKGDQVFNNYGPKSNEELLLSYGFCLEDNLDDLVMLKTNFSRDPDQERKTEILKYIGITNDTVHFLRRDVIPDSLLWAMRVMAMNPTELSRYHAMIQNLDQNGVDNETDEARELRLEISCLTIKANLEKELQFIGLRNEFAMLDLMDMLLGTKLQGMVEWDLKLNSSGVSMLEFVKIYRQGQKEILDSCAELCRGMFSVLLKEASSDEWPIEQAVFGSTSAQGQRRLEPHGFYTPERFKDAAMQEERSMVNLKQDAMQQVVLNAENIMIKHKDDLFGEAFTTVFPNHGWGEPLDNDLDEEEEMAVQMEQDAIVTCFLIFLTQQPGRLGHFIAAAKKVDYSSELDEDMKADVEDLRQSLQGTLEEIDSKHFDFSTTFTSKSFIWATGLLEALLLTLHINGESVSGIVAPRGPPAEDGHHQKRKLEN